MNAPTERDVKKLFALSLNQCAFPDCISPIFTLTDETLGEICHIKARSEGGPRFDKDQTDAERHSFGNLILLCRNHHKVVDDCPDKYTVEWLKKIKHEHEKGGSLEINQHEVVLAKRLLDAYLSKANVNLGDGVQQIAHANKGNVTQVAGDYHNYEKPERPKVVVTPPAGAVSPAELEQIRKWIESLVENTIDMSQTDAWKMWRSRFKNRFHLERSEQLLSEQMPEAGAWYRQQMAISKRGLKTKAPDAWRNARYAAIKMAMAQMGVDKLAYYNQLSTRLKMKKHFKSLTELTKINLERVYTMVLRDARGG